MSIRAPNDCRDYGSQCCSLSLKFCFPRVSVVIARMCGFSATPRRNAELSSRSCLRDFERDSGSRRYPTVRLSRRMRAASHLARKHERSASSNSRVLKERVRRLASRSEVDDQFSLGSRAAGEDQADSDIVLREPVRTVMDGSSFERCRFTDAALAGAA